MWLDGQMGKNKLLKTIENATKWPASEHQVRKHLSYVHLTKSWQEGIRVINAVVDRLDVEFDLSRSNCVFCQYFALKRMIRFGINEFRRTGILYEKSLKDFDSTNETILMELPNDVDYTPYYEKSCREVDKEIKSMHQDLIVLKEILHAKCVSLHTLSCNYEDSKRYFPCQRYSVLLLMVNNIIQQKTTSNEAHALLRQDNSV